MGTVGGPQQEVHVLLRDGVPARIRPLRSDDVDALRRFHERQSAESTYQRFFAPLPRLTERTIARLLAVDQKERVALVVTQVRDGVEEFLAVGRFDRYGDNAAELAFNVADAAHGRGIASILLEHLTEVGRGHGIARFTAQILVTNSRMIQVFDQAGYTITKRHTDDVVEVELHLETTRAALDIKAEREWHSDAASMARVVAGRHIVLVLDPSLAGSYRPEALSLLHANLCRSTAPIVVTVTVPPGASLADLDTVAMDLSCWQRKPLTDIHTADTALILTDVTASIAVVDLLSGTGLGAVVVYGDGDNAAEHSVELLRHCRRLGIRLLGPASAGFRATRADGTLDVSTLDLGPIQDWDHSSGTAPQGLGVFCHSPTAASILSEQFVRDRAPITSFVSTGHRMDIGGNDVLQYWATDMTVGAAAVHLETLGNGRKFVRAARRLSRKIPVVVVAQATTGTSRIAGHRVPTTVATRRTLTQLLRQCGVMQVRDTVELSELARWCLTEPAPTGSGAVYVETADETARALAVGALEEAGLSVVPHLTDADMHWILQYDNAGLSRADESRPPADLTVPKKPTMYIGSVTNKTSEPAFATVQSAACQLVRLVAYRRWLDRAIGSEPLQHIDQIQAQRLIASVPFGAVSRKKVGDVLACYGIAVAPLAVIDSVEAAVQAAAQFGYPVALTSPSAALRHRADLGAVRLGIGSEVELRATVASMLRDLRALDPQHRGLRLQSMAPVGTGCVVASREDPVFGPVVEFAIAGDSADVFDDVTEIIVPAAPADFREAVLSLKSSSRLVQSAPKGSVDTAGLWDLMGRVAQLADDFPEIVSLQLRPVVVSAETVTVLDVRMVLGPGQRYDRFGRRLAWYSGLDLVDG